MMRGWRCKVDCERLRVLSLRYEKVDFRVMNKIQILMG